MESPLRLKQLHIALRLLLRASNKFQQKIKDSRAQNYFSYSLAFLEILQTRSAELFGNKLSIKTGFLQQLIMCTGFHHAALMKDYYPVRVTDGREPMCDDDGSSICLKQIKSFVDSVFAESVEMRSGLV